MMLSRRKIYHVYPDNGQWKVKAELAIRASSIHDKKPDAIARAKELARTKRLSGVVVHRTDGSVQAEYIYGHDPVYSDV